MEINKIYIAISILIALFIVIRLIVTVFKEEDKTIKAEKEIEKQIKDILG